MSKTQIFIEKARAKHGDRYDYSKAVYVHSKEKIIITCKEHGDFKQTPANHIFGAGGCTRCSGVHRYNTDEWVKEALIVHGGQYSYANSSYSGSLDKIIVTCKRHGDFEQVASSHLMGAGCGKCVGKNKTTESWVAEVSIVHGDLYDYSKTVYVRDSDKVIITCKVHGDFEQRPSSHTGGNGCARCTGQHSHSSEEWIALAQKVHGDRYDYSKVVYVRAHDKVVVTCREHGDFEQRPSDHLRGSGCPVCGNKNHYDKPTAIYLMQMGAQVKIGISIDPDARLAQLNRNNPNPAHIISTWTLEDFPTAHAMEQRIHRKLKAYHAGLTGFDGATEWFNTTPDRAKTAIIKALSGVDVLSYCNANSSQLLLF